MSHNAAALPTLILASGSPRRQELIRLLGLPVEVVPSNVDEDTPADWTPEQIVLGLSRRKALSVKEQIAGQALGSSIIVGSDTIVVLENEVMGKPAGTEDAIRMLRRLAGRTHEVYTGVTCVRIEDGNTMISDQPEVIVGHSVSKVTFTQMSDDEIMAYIKTGEPFDKAGSYGVQGFGAVFIEKIEGDFYSIMGLPLNLLYQMLLKLGVRIFENR
jgi:septum formation protein